MFVLKKNIQKIIEKAKEAGYKEGIEYASKIADIEQYKISEKYELEITELKSELFIKNQQHKNILEREKIFMEKERIADQTLLKAKHIVLQVQQVLENIAQSTARGGADIEQIRCSIEGNVKKVMENK